MYALCLQVPEGDRRRFFGTGLRSCELEPSSRTSLSASSGVTHLTPALGRKRRVDFCV